MFRGRFTGEREDAGRSQRPFVGTMPKRFGMGEVTRVYYCALGDGVYANPLGSEPVKDRRRRMP